MTKDPTYINNVCSMCQSIQTKKKIMFIVLACIVSASIVLSIPYINVVIPKSSLEPIKTTRNSLQKKPVPGEKHMLFIESSCADKNFRPPKGKGILLSARQACSIESAARTNPDALIYLLYTCPITENFIEESKEFVFWLLQYPNIRLWLLQLDDYFKDTPLESFYKAGGWNSSHWPIVHASDVLRYLSLWKFGGTYLDLDSIVTKPIDDLGSNFAGSENSEILANGVLNFGLDRVGRDMARDCLEEIKTNFKGDQWGHNGPMLVTRVAAKICNTTKTPEMTPERCRGFTGFPGYVFYPITYNELQLFFNESLRVEAMQHVQRGHMVHMWNTLTIGTPVPVGSLQALALIAKEYCPEVYTHCGPIF